MSLRDQIVAAIEKAKVISERDHLAKMHLRQGEKVESTFNIDANGISYEFFRDYGPVPEDHDDEYSWIQYGFLGRHLVTWESLDQNESI